MIIALGIAGGPERVYKPQLRVYYLAPIDAVRDRIIRGILIDGEFLGGGTDFTTRDMAFAFGTPYRAAKAGSLLKRIKLIDTWKVRC